MAQKPAVPSLDDVLTAVVGAFTLAGTEYPVLGLNAMEYQMVQAIEDGTLPTDAPIWACVRRVVPSLPADVFATLTMPACGAIIGIAKHGIGQVTEALPNSSGPTATTTSAPTPAPAGSPAT